MVFSQELMQHLKNIVAVVSVLSPNFCISMQIDDPSLEFVVFSISLKVDSKDIYKEQEKHFKSIILDYFFVAYLSLFFPLQI